MKTTIVTKENKDSCISRKHKYNELRYFYGVINKLTNSKL